MPKTYEISEEQAKEIANLRKTIDDKQVDRRLRTLAAFLRWAVCSTSICRTTGSSISACG